MYRRAKEARKIEEEGKGINTVTHAARHGEEKEGEEREREPWTS